MSFDFLSKMPTPDELKKDFPLSDDLAKLKSERDDEIKKVFTGESDKFLLIIGPCSADHEDAVIDYISRLSRIQEKVSDKILVIPRIYTN